MTSGCPALEVGEEIMSKPSTGKRPPEMNRVDPADIFGLPGGDVTEMWSKAMNDLVGSEASREAGARAFDSYLTMSASAHRLFSQFMGQILGQLNLPTQGEIISLAERLTNIEMRLDDLDARLDQMTRLIETIAGAARQAAPVESDERSPRARRTTRAVSTESGILRQRPARAHGAKGADRQSSKVARE
jgi:hypothetical protein